MSTIFKIAEVIDTDLDRARKAGVRRGINAAKEAIEFCLAQNAKGSMAYNELQRALQLIDRLTIDEVEG